MIVEDNESMRDLLSTLLKLEGFEVILPQPAVNEIISTYNETLPDIIVMDYYLPGFIAPHIIKLIQLIDKKQPKIIVTSGEYLQFESMQAGATGFLIKPFFPSELIKQLHAWSKEISI